MALLKSRETTPTAFYSSSKLVTHVIEEGHIGQAGPTFPKPMLAGPDPLVVPPDITHDLSLLADGCPIHQAPAGTSLVSQDLC